MISVPEPPLSERRLCFVLGKGGAGKSTVAAALGLNSATERRRTLVIEVSSQRRLPHLFGIAGPRDDHRDVEVRLAPDLWTLSIDPQHATEEYLAGQLKVRPVVEMLARSRAFSHFTSAAPGLAELVSLGKIWSLAVALQPDKRTPVWDRLIVDCPATGHGIALLETAQNVEDLAGGGPIRDQAARIQEVISHPAATGVAVVARPEELSVTEACEAVVTLREAGLPVAAAFMNGMRHDRFHDADEPALRRLTAEPAGAVTTAAAASLRQLLGRRHDVAFRERLARETALPVQELPQLVRRTMGPTGIAILADHLGESR